MFHHFQRENILQVCKQEEESLKHEVIERASYHVFQLRFCPVIKWEGNELSINVNTQDHLAFLSLNNSIKFSIFAPHAQICWQHLQYLVSGISFSWPKYCKRYMEIKIDDTDSLISCQLILKTILSLLKFAGTLMCRFHFENLIFTFRISLLSRYNHKCVLVIHFFPLKNV